MRLSRSEQRLRRRARARTLQALYAWDVLGRHDLVADAERLWTDLAVGAGERAFADPLVKVIAERRQEIDTLLADVTTNWRMGRLGAVERALLRLGVAELLTEAIPPRVTIQESVRLAERFGSDESARFVNGVLDAVARRLGRL